MKSSSALFVVVLAMTLTACGEKKTVGYQGPPPAQPAPSDEAPAETNNQGGVTTGPQPATRPGPGADRDQGRPRNDERPPVTDVRPLPPSDNGGDLPIPPDDTASAPIPRAPVTTIPDPVDRRPQPPVSEMPPVAGQPLALSPWFAPDIEDGPAQSWLHYNIRPVLASTQMGGPQAIILPRRVKITIAIGYFDGYHKKDFVYENRSYGRHVPVDPWLRAMTERLVSEDCRGRNQLCGFERTGDNGVESFYRRAGRDGIIQDLRVISAALSTDHVTNTRREAELQRARSAAAESAFHRSLGDSDLVIYVGHSRMGGGPDFYPARLNASGDVNYPSYQSERRGIKSLTQALRRQSGKNGGLAILSCDSTDLFLRDLQTAAPSRQILTVRGIVSSEDLLGGALAAGDLFLRQGRLDGVNGFLGSQRIMGRSLVLRNPGQLAGR